MSSMTQTFRFAMRLSMQKIPPSKQAGGVCGAHGQEQTALPSWLLQLYSQPPASFLHWSMGRQMPVVEWPPSCAASASHKEIF